MNGVHDMGGMHGFGPIEREENEPVFHEPWEGRVYGMITSIRGVHDVYSPHGSRFFIESIPPDRYLASSYYERWLLAFEDALLRKGIVTAEELAEKTTLYRQDPNTPVPPLRDRELTRRVQESIYARPIRRDESAKPAPRYREGDNVRTLNIHPRGHTRLPRYVRGKRGKVVAFYGLQDFQDHVPESDRGPQPVYSVRFDGGELWGDSAEPNQTLYIDMWESYLEPA